MNGMAFTSRLGSQRSQAWRRVPLWRFAVPDWAEQHEPAWPDMGFNALPIALPAVGGRRQIGDQNRLFADIGQQRGDQLSRSMMVALAIPPPAHIV